MLVRQILSAKAHQNIYSVTPNSTVRQAIDLLATHRIGALMVLTDATTLNGIISERDIVRELGSKGPDALMSRVSNLMTSSVIACDPSDTAVSVLEKMTEGRFRHMPVVEGGKVIAVISIGDVVKARIDEVEHENSALADMIAGNA